MADIDNRRFVRGGAPVAARGEPAEAEPNQRPVEEPAVPPEEPAPSADQQAGAETAQPASPRPGRPWVRPLVFSIIAVLVVLGAVLGVRYWRFASTHTSTDDAYLTADVTQIAPQVAGTVSQVNVKEGQQVKAGDLLVVLDDSTFRANVAQAQANLDAAVSQAQGAASTVSVTSQTGSAAVQQAQGGVQQSEAAIAGARADVARSQAQLATAVASLHAAQQGVISAQAAAERASRDARRYASLAAQGAVSRQQAEQAGFANQQAQAALQAARDQVGVAQANEAQARAAIAAAQQNVTAAQAKRQQALGQLSQARTAPQQVAVSKSAQAQAAAKIEQARAALDAAKLQLSYTRITAPISGQVSRKTVDPGELVQPGGALMAIVPTGGVWLQANFKETQMAHIRPGASAEVEVDALPKHPFRAHVTAITKATGSTFALLPPDNATGNFTKVVQRIPVRVDLDPSQPDLNRLAAGMSATAVVENR